MTRRLAILALLSGAATCAMARTAPGAVASERTTEAKPAASVQEALRLELVRRVGVTYKAVQVRDVSVSAMDQALVGAVPEFLARDVAPLKAALRPGDHLVEFTTGAWGQLSGRQGYAVVRGTRVVELFYTVMS